MNLFRKASIKRKQVLIIMAITTVALLLACAVFTVYEIVTFRSGMVGNLSTLAQIIGNNTASALDFNDPKAAAETLSALEAESHIVGACLYAANGKAFAEYHRLTDRAAFTPPSTPPALDHAFQNGGLTLSRRIVSKGDTVGTVYLVSDIGGLYARLGQDATIIATVLVLTMIVALALSNTWQRFISEPILQLARAARAVGQNKDYSIRVQEHNPDEIGVLIDGFNGMLEQIQARDIELQKENLERKQAEAAVRRTEELYRRAISGADAVPYAYDDRSKAYLFVDEGIERLTGYTPQEITPKLWTQIIQESVMSGQTAGLDKEEAFRRVIRGEIRNWRCDMQVRTRDGATRWISDAAVHTFDEAKQFTGSIGILQDITERKKAEAELEAAHRELVGISRQAGMAEVATSVLHNVGNVLNSINVSTTLVLEAVQSSKTRNIARLAALLREHKDHLPAFFDSDPKGKQVPDYLEYLAAETEHEQAYLIKEMQQTRKNIEHIKDIVMMQQSYARVSGVVEKVSPVHLIEDALRMNTAALARHNVRVARDYAPGITEILVDKHKVLQILVNLIRNAKYACDESSRKDRTLTLELRNGGAAVQFSIIDNGVGIVRENMTRIFNHGFTTRKTGHGFGLHSGALAAREMGGTLTAHSDGPGTGARFTLEVPLEPPHSHGHP